MLKGISWGQYWMFITVMVLIYYSYVLIRYYGAELRQRILPRIGRPNHKSVTVGLEAGRAQGQGTSPASARQAAVLPKDELEHAANEPFESMQKTMGTIRQLIAQARDNQMDRDNVLDHIAQVLWEQRFLKNSEYSSTIDSFLIRECAAELSIQLLDDDLASLWK